MASWEEALQPLAQDQLTPVEYGRAIVSAVAKRPVTAVPFPASELVLKAIATMASFMQSHHALLENSTITSTLRLLSTILQDHPQLQTYFLTECGGSQLLLQHLQVDVGTAGWLRIAHAATTGWSSWVWWFLLDGVHEGRRAVIGLGGNFLRCLVDRLVEFMFKAEKDGNLDGLELALSTAANIVYAARIAAPAAEDPTEAKGEASVRTVFRLLVRCLSSERTGVIMASLELLVHWVLVPTETGGGDDELCRKLFGANNLVQSYRLIFVLLQRAVGDMDGLVVESGEDRSNLIPVTHALRALELFASCTRTSDSLAAYDELTNGIRALWGLSYMERSSMLIPSLSVLLQILLPSRRRPDHMDSVKGSVVRHIACKERIPHLLKLALHANSIVQAIAVHILVSLVLEVPTIVTENDFRRTLRIMLERCQFCDESNESMVDNPTTAYRISTLTLVRYTCVTSSLLDMVLARVSASKIAKAASGQWTGAATPMSSTMLACTASDFLLWFLPALRTSAERYDGDVSMATAEVLKQSPQLLHDISTGVVDDKVAKAMLHPYFQPDRVDLLARFSAVLSDTTSRLIGESILRVVQFCSTQTTVYDFSADVDVPRGLARMHVYYTLVKGWYSATPVPPAVPATTGIRGTAFDRLAPTMNSVEFWKRHAQEAMSCRDDLEKRVREVQALIHEERQLRSRFESECESLRGELKTVMTDLDGKHTEASVSRKELKENQVKAETLEKELHEKNKILDQTYRKLILLADAYNDQEQELKRRDAVGVDHQKALEERCQRAESAQKDMEAKLENLRKEYADLLHTNEMERQRALEAETLRTRVRKQEDELAELRHVTSLIHSLSIRGNPLQGAGEQSRSTVAKDNSYLPDVSAIPPRTES